MMKKTATANFQFDLSKSGTAPDRIQLFSEGSEIVARDGRRWLLDGEDKQNILSGFRANEGPLVIDYEHEQAHLAAAVQIMAGEYRFISPEFTHANTDYIFSIDGTEQVNGQALKAVCIDNHEYQPGDVLHADLNRASVDGLYRLNAIG